MRSVCQASSPGRNPGWPEWVLAERCILAVWINTSGPWSRQKHWVEGLGSACPAEDRLVTRKNKQGVW